MKSELSQASRTNRLATVSLVSAIVAATINGLAIVSRLAAGTGADVTLLCSGSGAIMGLAALVMGLLSYLKIRKSNGTRARGRLAVAGMLLGTLGLIVGMYIFYLALGEAFIKAFEIMIPGPL